MIQEDEAPNYAKGLAWTLSFNVVMKVTAGVIAIFIARKLGPAEIGIFGLLSTIYILAEQMREAGLKQAYYNDNGITPIKFRTYARLSVMSGVTFGVILFLLSWPLANFFDKPQLAWSAQWAAFATFVNGLAVIPMASLHKGGRFRDVGIIETVGTVVSSLVALGLVLVGGFGFGALVVQLVLRSTIVFALAFWQQPFSVLNHDRQMARSILRICTPLVATDLLWLVYSLADQLTITKLLGTTPNGFYAQGKRILSIPSDFIFFPMVRTVAVAIGNRSTSPDDLARTFMKALCLATLLLGGVMGACAMLAKPVVLALLTEKFAATIPIFGIICLTEGSKLLGSFAGSALVASGRSKIPLFAWILPYPVAIAGIWMNWSHLSLAAIVWSFAAGMVVVNVVVITAAFRFLRPALRQLRRFAQCMAISAATTAFAYVLSFLPLTPWSVVGIAAISIPVFHALLIGTIFAKNPLAFMSLSGARRFRESL